MFQLGLNYITHQWKDSPIMLILQTGSQFWFVWSHSLLKRLFSLLLPSPAFFQTSVSHMHTHILTTNTPMLYTLIPVGPPAVLLGGLTQPIICRQPVGISLRAWQTVILNTTRTHRGKEGVLLLHCDLTRAQPNNNQKNLTGKRLENIMLHSVLPCWVLLSCQTCCRV